MTDERDSNELVAERLKQRAAEGLAKYNKPLKPWDGRNTVIDAIEEALDMAVYLTKLQSERAEVAEFLGIISEKAWATGDIELFNRANELREGLTADIPRVGDAGYKSPSEPDRIQYHHTQRPAQERLEEMDDQFDELVTAGIKEARRNMVGGEH